MSYQLKQIQGIRALAMLGIFFAHTTVWLPACLNAVVPVALKLGASGVAAFFIISGFLLAYKHKSVPLIDKKDVLPAAWKKVSKMYILFLITLLVCFIAKWPTSAYDWLEKTVFMLFHLTLTQDFIPFDALINAFNAPAWFLSALFGIWILIYLFPRPVNAMMELSAKKCIIAIVVLMLTQIVWMLLVKYGIVPIMPKKYLAWCHDWLVYKNPIICYSEYCVGVLLGRLCAQKHLPVAIENGIALGMLLIVIGYVAILVHAVSIPSTLKMVIAECFICLGITAVMSPLSMGYRILSMKPLVWFGNVSGYFFLIHTVVIFSMRVIKDCVPRPWLILMSFIFSALMAEISNLLYTRNREKMNNP